MAIFTENVDREDETANGQTWEAVVSGVARGAQNESYSFLSAHETRGAPTGIHPPCVRHHPPTILNVKYTMLTSILYRLYVYSVRGAVGRR